MNVGSSQCIFFVLIATAACFFLEDEAVELANPTPEVCQAALGIDLTHVLRVYPSYDSVAADIAYRIDSALYTPYTSDNQPEAETVDSLVAVYGRGLLSRSLEMMLFSHVDFEPLSRIGYVYGTIGEDMRFPRTLALDTLAPLKSRMVGLDALDSAAKSGRPLDSTTAMTAASVLCELAYVSRPLFPADTGVVEWHEYLEEPSVGAHFTTALILGNCMLPGGAELLRVYRSWEPATKLHTHASVVLDRMEEWQPRCRKNEKAGRDRKP
jgi:hypothetical protein